MWEEVKGEQYPVQTFLEKNNERADRAFATLKEHVEQLGEQFEGSSSEISDLIADLLHLTRRLDQGDDPIESTIQRAKMHFNAEEAGEDDDQTQ